MEFSSNEFSTLASALEEHHSSFYFLWKAGKPIFTETVNNKSLPTAAISVSPFNQIIFYINPNYWNSCSFNKKKFVICHESLHLILDHFQRSKFLTSKEDIELSNYAEDAIANQMLVNNFGFDRKEIDPDDKFAWHDTLINRLAMEPNKSREYYFDLLKQNCGGLTNKNLVDDHNFQNIDPNAINSIINSIPQNDKDSLLSIVGEKFEKISATKKKFSWPKAFLKVLSNKLADDKNVKEEETWLQSNKRLSLIKTNLALPNIILNQGPKPKIWAFIDVSWSCNHLTQNFFDLVESLPNSFDKQIFAFSGKVSKINKTSSGLEYSRNDHTKFNKIEEYIRANSKVYPDMICIFTDGIGGWVSPRYPSKWFWFLSKPKYSYIPKQSKRYLIDAL